MYIRSEIFKEKTQRNEMTKKSGRRSSAVSFHRREFAVHASSVVQMALILLRCEIERRFKRFKRNIELMLGLMSNHILKVDGFFDFNIFSNQYFFTITKIIMNKI